MKAILLLLFLSSIQAANALPPERSYWITPDSLGLRYVSNRLITPDGAELQSWMLSTKAAEPLKATLIIVYAGTGNMANSVYYADAFLKAGFDIALFDYRGFGHSSDFAIDPAYLYYNEYITDLKTAIVAAKKQFPENSFGVLSFSMSTILATLAAKDQPIDFLVGEGYIRDPQLIVDFWKKEDPGHRLVLPKGADTYVKATQRISCPMLLLTGTKDDVTPPSDVRAVAALRPNRKVILYNGHHLEGTEAWKEKEFADGYVRRIREFVTLHR